MVLRDFVVEALAGDKGEAVKHAMLQVEGHLQTYFFLPAGISALEYCVAELINTLSRDYSVANTLLLAAKNNWENLIRALHNAIVAAIR